MGGKNKKGVPKKPIPEHGTRQRYISRVAPCRCKDCTKANSDYQQMRRTGSVKRKVWSIYPDTTGWEDARA